MSDVLLDALKRDFEVFAGYTQYHIVKMKGAFASGNYEEARLAQTKVVANVEHMSRILDAVTTKEEKA